MAVDELYFGLTSLRVGEPVELGGGVFIRPASCQFLTPLTLKNSKPSTLGDIQPALWQFHTRPIDVTSELVVPTPTTTDLAPALEQATLVVLLIKLWCDPAITMPVIADQSFGTLGAGDVNNPIVIPHETSPRYFPLGAANMDNVHERLKWVADHWQGAMSLYRGNPKFKLAADALNEGQFVRNNALALISLWGAIEALFAPQAGELKFRVSALMAAYLEPPGETRHTRQKAIAALYQHRSSAAHGTPKHKDEDLLATFDLARTLLVKMIRENLVPTQEFLEANLFGSGGRSD